MPVIQEWLATLDGRTRHSHAVLDGEQVAQDKKFSNGCRYPGDPRGPAWEIYNCRCTLVAAIDGIDTSSAKRRARISVGDNEIISNMTYKQWVERKALEKSLKDGLKNAIIGTPIDNRNSVKGKPQAISIFDSELNSRQEQLLTKLPEYDSTVVVPKKAVNMKDLSALTAKTGVEFAMFTRKGERLVIRGNEQSVNVTEAKARELSAEGYKWSGHTHPGDDELTKAASYGDMQILKAFGQTQSAIYDSLGRYEIFRR